MSKPTKALGSSAAIKAVGLGLGFGTCLAAEIYLLGIVVGGWLDTKLNSAPWCMLAGILLAIAAAFWQLLRGLDFWQKREEK